MKYPSAVIQVFCKAPVPGTVKTRLQPALNDEQAAEVHQQLTRQTLDLVCSDNLCAVQLWCSPDNSHAFFAQQANDYPVALKIQHEGDLGLRMDQALTEGLKHYRQAILIGCDCPSLVQADFIVALQALNKNYDAVLAPTEDGGYSLIGLTRPAPELFQNVEWSTSGVLPQTRENMLQARLNCLELSMQWDVDTYTDYVRFSNQSAIAIDRKNRDVL